ncbi:type II secretion system pilot lipoprotein GspS [Yersinia alsatica]|uniref:type II secretion system pilot lipoprotein GspS n=1 Tax=Yersinia alsatica TaxID=2890317 RepID=UPI0011A32C19|nr:type II secretion system pilot lipoprotein GspS [Yersinia alsatica]
MRVKKIKAMLFITPIIFGCQLNNKNSFIGKNTIEKITALTSSMRFLKEICHIEGLANEEEIVNSAVRMIKKDKLTLSSEFYITISNKTQARYEEIKAHKVEQDIKCNELKNTLSSFINRMRE